MKLTPTYMISVMRSNILLKVYKINKIEQAHAKIYMCSCTNIKQQKMKETPKKMFKARKRRGKKNKIKRGHMTTIIGMAN